ncbi:protein O10 [Saimiriine betaherpesvirus 4]|uniref:Protein O10 n=1 Tax=Saimiriine betaherpesvirus 4 TaxID=1535247 RepID=G8XST6_9BETA|nr:protein O10 [Saimiriine betaherpesvirus 4]AEV80883.1 protein O10 [Saimiriine betaherpesvirus 4]
MRLHSTCIVLSIWTLRTIFGRPTPDLSSPANEVAKTAPETWTRFYQHLTGTTETGIEEHDSDGENHDHHITTPEKPEVHTTPSGMKHPHGMDSFAIRCILGYDCDNTKLPPQTFKPSIMVR